ncbi:hypothetical protein V5O48_019090, partial [Marasmius crinis-equi]
MDFDGGLDEVNDVIIEHHMGGSRAGDTGASGSGVASGDANGGANGGGRKKGKQECCQNGHWHFADSECKK